MPVLSGKKDLFDSLLMTKLVPFVFEKAKMIEKRNTIVDYCLCDSSQLIYVVTNIITVITITNSIAVFNFHGNSKQSKNKHNGDLMFFK
jgi:hypothetical protein